MLYYSCARTVTEWLNVEPVTEARIGRGAPYPWVRIPQSGHAKTPMKPIDPYWER